MVDFQGRRRWRAVAYSRPVAVVLAVGVLLLGHSVLRVYLRSRAVARERGLAAAQLEALENRRFQLETEIAALKTDHGVEEEIRKKFPVVRAGEKVILVVPDELAATTTAAGSAGSDSRLRSFLRGISLVVGRLLPKQ